MLGSGSRALDGLGRPLRAKALYDSLVRLVRVVSSFLEPRTLAESSSDNQKRRKPSHYENMAVAPSISAKAVCLPPAGNFLLIRSHALSFLLGVLLV